MYLWCHWRILLLPCLVAPTQYSGLMCCSILQDACAIQYVSESGDSGMLQGASIVLTGTAGSATPMIGPLTCFSFYHLLTLYLLILNILQHAASSQNGLSDALHLACKSIILDQSETSVVLPAMGLRSGTTTGMYFGAGYVII